MTDAACHTHPDVPAIASCSRCFALLCRACRHIDGVHTVCGDCLRIARRKGRVGGAIAVLLVAAASAGGYWFYAHHKAPYDYGRHGGKVSKLEAELAQEPCDRPKAIELLSELLTAGDSRGALVRADAFWGKCGEFLDLRHITYRAHANLGEFDQAAADVTKLIDSEPSNESYHAWRGFVFEEKGDLERAAEDFRQALAYNPKLSDVPLNLATIYERMGRPCDACFPLEQLVFQYPGKPWVADIRARIDQLSRKGDCAGAASSANHVVIRLGPNEGAFRAKTRVNDHDVGSFVVDTGASYVTLTRAVAERIGVSTDRTPKLVLRTANGERVGSFVTLDTVALEGLTARHVPAVVVDDLGPKIDGLLGLSFLVRFDVRQAKLVMEIVGPPPPPR